MSGGPCKGGGGGGGSPSIQVHRKDGQACLLMPWDTMFSEEQQEQQRGGGRGEWKERGSREEREKM